MTKKLLYIIPILLLLVMSPSFGFATDYYVKNSGNDATDGLSDVNAWATIGKVNSIDLVSGDNVYFNSGDRWREKLEIRAADSGADGNLVRFTSYGTGNQPVISGAEIEMSWTQEGSHYFASGYTDNPGVVVKDGMLLKRMENKADVNAVDEWWYDAGIDRVYIYFDPVSYTMEIGNYSRRLAIYAGSGVEYVIIDDICLRDGCRGVHTYPNTIMTFQNLTVKNFADWGVCIAPKNNVLNCDISYIHDPGIKQSGITSDASGYRIAGNEISWCGYYMCTYAQGSAVVYNHSNVIIEDNDIHHCGLGHTQSYTQSWGMDHGLKLGAAGAIVRHNRVHHNIAGIGIIVGGNDMNVHHNEVWGNGVGMAHVATTTGCKINNNVIYKNCVSHGDSCGFLINDGIVSEFKNNILCMNGNLPYSKQIWFRMGGTDDILDCDNNFIYGPTDPNADICRIVGTGYTWAEWQAAGYDEDSINLSNPGMVDADNNDFRLLAGSPCIDAGVGVGLNLDFIGVAIPQGSGPDIGAYEFVQSGEGQEVGRATIKLIIQEIPSCDVVANPTEQTVEKGKATSYEITLDTEGGFNEVVTLSISGVPVGVTATFTSATIQPGESSILNVSVADAAVVGEYDMEVIGMVNN